MLIATIMNRYGGEETHEVQSEYEARELCRKEGGVLIGINSKECLL